MIVVPSAKSGPVLCLRPDQTGDLTEKPDAVIWKLERGTPDVATPVVHEGLVYFCRENGVLLVLDVATGETTFNERLMEDRHRSSPVIVGDKLIIAGRKGDVMVVQTGREPKLLATNSLGEELTASPAVADGRVYIRTFDALYAFGSN
jgi:outer membrane protein assembly factor BamB